MEKRLFAFIFLLMFTLWSCASTQEKPDAPVFKLGDLTLSKSIEKTDTSATAINITSNFVLSDLQVVASVKLEGLTGSHELRWEWFDPKGELFLSSGDYAIRTVEGKYRKVTTAWHKLLIKGERPANHPGTWQVKLFYDGRLTAERDFTLE
jgi:hypothetical protein